MRFITPLTFAALGGALLFPAATAAESAESAAANWQKHCVSCHGADGRGKTRMGQRLKITDLTEPARQAEFTDAAAASAIRDGLKDESGKTTMKAVEGLSTEEIDALVAYVRSLAKR